MSFKERFKSMWPSIKAGLLDYLKTEAVQKLIAKVISSYALGGIRAWAVKFAIKHLYNEVAEPIAKAVLIKAEYKFYKIEGRSIVVKMTEAERIKDEAAYNAALDELLS